MSRRGTALRATFAGAGPSAGPIQRYLRRNGMDSWIRLAGRLQPGEVRELLAGADLFVNPCRRESFGIAALEARTSGLPVLARAHTGVADFVRHNREGALCGHSAFALADEVLWLARTPGARSALAAHNWRPSRCTAPGPWSPKRSPTPTTTSPADAPSPRIRRRPPRDSGHRNGRKVFMHRVLDRAHRILFASLSFLGLRGQGRVLHWYFDWWHRRPDPWGLAVDDYEQSKYATTLRQLPRRRYRRILDVGCSEGTFTHRLAAAFPHAEVTGMDISERALARARAPEAGRTPVPGRPLVPGRIPAPRFARLNILTAPPEDRFNLVFCAELLCSLGRHRHLRRPAPI